MRRFAAVSAVFWLAGLALSLSGGGAPADRWVIAAVTAAAFGVKLHLRQFAQAAACLLLLLTAFFYGTLCERNGVSGLPEEAAAFALEGYVSSPVEIDGDRIRFVLRAVKPVRERVMATVKAASPAELEAAAGWRRGDRLIVTGELKLPASARNFGQFDYRRHLDRQNIWRTLSADGLGSVQAAVPERGERVRYAPLRLADEWRGRLNERISQLYGEHRGLMSGLLIGLADDLSEERFMVFSRLGLTHIIAISGLHVGIVVGFCIGALRLLRFTRETALTAAIFLIPPYVLLSGAAPSVVRAGIMGMIGLYAAKRGWLKDGLNILAAAAMLMTVINPRLIFNVSFQLSFAVTAGLILLTPSLLRLLPRLPKWAAGFLAVSVAAQLAAFPLTVFYFNQFSLLSLPANLLIVPLYSLVVLPAGYASLVLSAFSWPLAHGLAAIAARAVDVSYRLMDLFDAASGALTIWPSPPTGWIAVYYLMLFWLISAAVRVKESDGELWPRRARAAKIGLTAGAALFALWLAAGYQLEDWKDRGSVSFLDVGQGDAILIRTPADCVILVDGGGTIFFERPGEEWRQRKDPFEVGEDLLVPLLKKRGVRSIDYLVATHGDADHIGGLAAVVEQLPVKRILFNGSVRKSEHAEKLFRSALLKGIPVYAVSAGERIAVDRRTTIEVLHPEEGKLTLAEEQNVRSVVLLLRMREAKFLLTGDMDAAAEREVLDRLAAEAAGGEHPSPRGQPGGGIDVLKVAHHGSKSSTTAPWLHYWSPRYAVISVGERNIYRHPSDIVLSRLTGRGIAVMRTDRHGEIRFDVLPSGLEWRTKLNPHADK